MLLGAAGSCENSLLSFFCRGTKTTFNLFTQQPSTYARKKGFTSLFPAPAVVSSYRKMKGCQLLLGMLGKLEILGRVGNAAMVVCSSLTSLLSLNSQMF